MIKTDPSDTESPCFHEKQGLFILYFLQIPDLARFSITTYYQKKEYLTEVFRWFLRESFFSYLKSGHHGKHSWKSKT